MLIELGDVSHKWYSEQSHVSEHIRHLDLATLKSKAVVDSGMSYISLVTCCCAAWPKGPKFIN